MPGARWLAQGSERERWVLRRYLRYRAAAEHAYLQEVSPAYRYLGRVYYWWTVNFPQYVFPSAHPNPHGTPPAPPMWLLAPAAVIERRIPVWEMQLHNLLLFGHSMPTTPEVEFRRAYLDWCAASTGAALLAHACARSARGPSRGRACMCPMHAGAAR
jgi:hypothetical protein